MSPKRRHTRKAPGPGFPDSYGWTWNTGTRHTGYGNEALDNLLDRYRLKDHDFDGLFEAGRRAKGTKRTNLRAA